jgi:hypothetical protein
VAFLVVFIILVVSVAADPDLDMDSELIQWDRWIQIQEKIAKFWS